MLILQQLFSFPNLSADRSLPNQLQSIILPFILQTQLSSEDWSLPNHLQQISGDHLLLRESDVFLSMRFARRHRKELFKLIIGKITHEIFLFWKYFFLLQQIAFKNLVQRNREHEKLNGRPPPNSAIQLPYIIVNTSKKTVIDCSISNDKWVGTSIQICFSHLRQSASYSWVGESIELLFDAAFNCRMQYWSIIWWYP